MGMKKKVLNTTLAASLVFTSLSAVPFSTNSWLNQVSVITAEAELPDEASGLLDKIDEWEDEISSRDQETLLDIGARISAIADAGAEPEYIAITKPLWEKINQKLEEVGREDYPNLKEENVSQTFLQLSAALLKEDRNARSAALNDIRTGEPTRNVIDELAKLNGEEGLDDISFFELETFLTELENNVIEVVDESDSLAEMTANLKSAITDTLDETESLFGSILQSTGVTADELLQVKTNLEMAITPGPEGERVDPEGEATMILALAFLKLHADDDDDSSSPYYPPLPPVTEDPDDSDDEDSDHEIVVPEDLEEQISALETRFRDMINEVGNVETEEEAVEAAEEAIKFAERAIRDLATLDVSTAVTVEDEVATAEFNTEQLKAAMEDVMSAVGDLNEMLNVNGVPVAELELTLDLGEVDADEVRVTLDEEVLEAARNSGVDMLNVKVNGVELLVSPQEFTNNTELVIRHNDEAHVSTGTWASSAYDIELFVNGEAQTSFTDPVKMRLPLTDVTGVDTELLTLVRLDGSESTIFGGKYNAESQTFVAQRNGLSTYVVMENNVTFDDLGPIAEWAGRSIEVAAAKGIISGRGGGEFDPRANLTRAEFATLLVKLFGLERPELTTDEFNDVAADAWYMPYIAAAVEEGLIYGRGNGKFDPGADVTRVEMAVMAARALDKYNRLIDVVNTEEFLQRFEDTADIFAGMKDDTALAIRENIMQGQADGVFNPDGNSTRAEAAVVIYNLLNQFDLE